METNDLEEGSLIIDPQRIFYQGAFATLAYNLYRVVPWDGEANVELVAHCPNEFDAQLLRAALLDLSVLWAGDVPS